jgi:hypothetical protein
MSMPDITVDTEELYSMPDKIGHPIVTESNGKYTIVDGEYHGEETQIIKFKNRELRVHIKKEG